MLSFIPVYTKQSPGHILVQKYKVGPLGLSCNKTYHCLVFIYLSLASEGGISKLIMKPKFSKNKCKPINNHSRMTPVHKAGERGGGLSQIIAFAVVFEGGGIKYCHG